MGRLAPFIVRVWNTAVFWTWMFNGLRLATGVLLMPLLWKLLSKPDLGIYALLFQFAGFLVTFDHMFAVTIARFVSYAMRGVTELQSFGVTPVAEPDAKPNPVLLGRLLGVTKRIYHLLSLGIFILLGIFGTLLLAGDLSKATNPKIAWAAWVITVTSACIELYTGYWLLFMRGMNQILLSTKLSTVIYGLKLLLAISLLLAHCGLLAVPIATLVSGLLQRLLARHFMRNSLPPGVHMDFTDNRKLIRSIWPSTWRVGAILISLNVMTVAFGLMISHKWGVAEVAPFHFSQQILYSVCVGMASVWTYVKWPIICQLRAANDFASLRRVVWQRLWLQLLTYIALATFSILVGPPLLKWVAPDKQLLAWPWLLTLAIYALLDMNYTFWTTLISTENRVPSLWPAVITNIVIIITASLLANFTSLRWGAFVITPLACQLLFNYWYWPKIGAEGIGARWFSFMFSNQLAAERNRVGLPAAFEPSTR